MPPDERWDLETCLDWVNDCKIWRGRVLHGANPHWCYEWDALPVDDTCSEAEACVRSHLCGFPAARPPSEGGGEP